MSWVERMGWRIFRAETSSSRSIAKPADSTASSSGCISGRATLIVRVAIQVAKPSLSQRSSHHSIVTRSPNHWCASSCVTTEVMLTR